MYSPASNRECTLQQMRVGSLKVANLEYLFVPHIPFPWGRFSIFHPDAIYQLCLSNNLLNVPLPFLSLLTSLSRGFYAGHPSTSDQLSFHGVFFFFFANSRYISPALLGEHLGRLWSLLYGLTQSS